MSVDRACSIRGLRYNKLSLASVDKGVRSGQGHEPLAASHPVLLGRRHGDRWGAVASEWCLGRDERSARGRDVAQRLLLRHAARGRLLLRVQKSRRTEG